MSEVRIYTLWASTSIWTPATWMIEARDEYAWEGNPDEADAAMKKAREAVEKDGCVVREITLVASLDAIHKAFEATEIGAVVEAAEGAKP